MIRWGRLAFLLTPLILIWAGTHFFLDRGIKSAIETAGTTAVGARVDVANVRTRFWGLSATVNGLAVTDPDHPMTNSIDIGTIRMNVQLKQNAPTREPVHFVDVNFNLYLNELICLCFANGAVFCGFAEFNVTADGAEVEINLCQILALLNSFERHLIQFCMDSFRFQCVAEHALGFVTFSLSLCEHGRIHYFCFIGFA